MSVNQSLDVHDKTFDAFVNGRLSKGEWTHEAHLLTCWMALQTGSPAEALIFLRNAITNGSNPGSNVITRLATP